MKTFSLRSSVLLSIILLWSLACPSRAGILDTWYWRNPTPFADTMQSICFGAGRFVAVGNGGLIHTSKDGLTWDNGQKPVMSSLNKVNFVNGHFVAVGDNGTILVSPDGLSWTNQVSGTTNILYAVTYGNGQYAACGQGGCVASSTNGVNWSVTNVGTSDLGWITFGNGVFILPTPGQQQAVYVSSDLQSWFTATFPNSVSHEWPHALMQAEFGNGGFVADVQDEVFFDPYWNRATHFYYSADGTNWTQGAPGGSFQMNFRFLTFANGTFDNSDGGSGSSAIFWQTPDGTAASWFLLPMTFSDATALSFGNGRYVMLGGGGEIWNSTDLTNWVAANGGFQGSFSHMIRGNSNYLVFGGSFPVLMSSDGISFTSESNSPSGVLSTAEFDGTNYVAVGVTVQVGHPTTYTGEVYTSSNSTDWVRRTSNANQPLYAICRGSNLWVAVGGAGTVITSPSALAWTLRASGTANSLNGVAFGNGTYVVAGSVGTIITSPDGATWTVQFSGTTSDLNDVRFFNGQFFAVGGSGTILTSTDGANWTSQNSGTATNLFSITYGYGGYLACGSAPGDVLLTSSSGVDWQDVTSKVPTISPLSSIAYLNHSFWLVGSSGAILQSASADGVPHLSGSRAPANAGFQLNVNILPPATYRIQFRSNLLSDSWHDIMIQTNPISSDAWTDTNAFNLPEGFYRAASP